MLGKGFVAGLVPYSSIHPTSCSDIHEDAATCSFPFGPALAEDYPDMMFEYQEDSLNMLKFNEEWFYLADSTVFDLFTFPFLHGDPGTALDRPNTIVLTESTAKKYFGDELAIGKILLVEEQIEMEVTGVMKDLPAQSHFNIQILAVIGIFVLILACINFMNLATASSVGRSREIGLKKVVGAAPFTAMSRTSPDSPSCSPYWPLL